MSAKFINVDRDTPMLFPLDMRDWVEADDPVHLFIEAINGMRLTTLKVNTRGSGSPQYPPKMMLTLLVYCYANGIFSSRKIERATYDLVSVRYVTGDTHPDHDTIATFRRENFEAIKEAFGQLLLLAHEMGVLKVGMVAIDGTHLRASATKDKNVRYDRLQELQEQLNKDIEELLAQAEQADDEDTKDSSLPEALDRREKLLAKLSQAREDLERRAKERAEREREAYEKKLADRQANPRGGQTPKPPDDQPKPEEQINLTDADSRLMRKSRRSSYEQCYNAQVTVDADPTNNSMLILSQHITQCANDANELIPGVRGVTKELGKITDVLADSGYVNIDAFKELEKEKDVKLYVAIGRQDNQRTYDYRPRSALDKPPAKVKDPRLLKMQETLQTDEGKKKYRQRKQTAEPVFGIIKNVMGFRQFLLRGMDQVSGEWSLVTLAYNFKRLATLAGR